MKTIKIDGYLTQEKLEKVLKQIVVKNWRGREVKVPDSRKRWDMSYEINNKITIVEFDGYAHYMDSLRIKSDDFKDNIAKKLDYKVVRIPFYVQLTTQMAKYYFGFDINIEQNFPHGFITSKTFPASFCEIGIKKFINDINTLPNNVSNDIVKSLKDRIIEYDEKYVITDSIKYLFR